MRNKQLALYDGTKALLEPEFYEAMSKGIAIQYSEDGTTWSDTPSDSDSYIRIKLTADTTDTWSNAIKLGTSGGTAPSPGSSIYREQLPIDEFRVMEMPVFGHPADPTSYIGVVDGYVMEVYTYPEQSYSDIPEQLILPMYYDSAINKTLILLHVVEYGRIMDLKSEDRGYLILDVLKEVITAPESIELHTVTGDVLIAEPNSSYRWVLEAPPYTYNLLPAIGKWASSGFQTTLLIITLEEDASLVMANIDVEDHDVLDEPGTYTCYIENQDGRLVFKRV